MAYLLFYRTKHKQNNCCIISESHSTQKIRYGIKWWKEVEKSCNYKQYRMCWDICICALAPVSEKVNQRLEIIFKVLYKMLFGLCIVFHCWEHMWTSLWVFYISLCKIYETIKSSWPLHCIYCILNVTGVKECSAINPIISVYLFLPGMLKNWVC